jgi:acyl-CoA synthetase (AMP-forming)/AMP-acid ligase II
MAFWDLEQHPSKAVALLNGTQPVNYGELAVQSDAASARLPNRRTFGFLSMPNRVDAVALYLGALRSRLHVPLLLHPDLDSGLLERLAEHYQPDWLALSSEQRPPPSYSPLPTNERDAKADLVLYLRDGEMSLAPPADQLALLLNTSGSTGSSKLVRHSAKGIAANAASIVEYLGLIARDRAITTMPLAYSFGMSILNSHLQAGASLVLNDHAVVSREFWDLARNSDITSLSGVPATFEMLRRLDLPRQRLPRLRTLTQAGGRLREVLVEHFDQLARQLDLSFFVMYGQTEAAPRISYVPPQRLAGKVGSIGIPVPGGALNVDNATGELLYRGPNVMLGYAEQRADLALGDCQGGILHTGDLARVDDEGFFYLTGRAKRFIKISGNRINLDEVEVMLARELRGLFACTGGDDDLVVFFTPASLTETAVVKQLIQKRYKLFHGHIRALALEDLPLMNSGKIDYAALLAMSRQQNTP